MWGITRLVPGAKQFRLSAGIRSSRLFRRSSKRCPIVPATVHLSVTSRHPLVRGHPGLVVRGVRLCRRGQDGHATGSGPEHRVTLLLLGATPFNQDPPLTRLNRWDTIFDMKYFLSTLLVLSLVCSAFAEEDGFRPLFNGKDLSGWVAVNTAPSTWTVVDGMIHCTGQPTGEMRTERMYQNFIMEVEWRHLKPKGNAGIFIWADDITARGQPFHRGIEVQVLEKGYYTKKGITQSNSRKALVLLGF